MSQVDVDKNIVLIPLAPDEDKAVVNKNIILIALGPEREIRRTVFVTHGE